MFDVSSIAAKVADFLHAFAEAEVFRIARTLIVACASYIALRVIQHHAMRSSAMMSMAEIRQRTVLARNVVFLFLSIALISLWATRIAGAALSLAAVAGAMLIVSKEAISNLLGFVMLTVVRPYGVGDFIEIATYRGRVVDVHAMGTTLLEMRDGSQMTGQTVVLPNSLLLTQAVRNHSATGEYAIFLLKVHIPHGEDICLHESVLLEAAEKSTSCWRAEADKHFELLERRRHVDLPSAEPKVILALDCDEGAKLSVRFACPPNMRVRTEQSILRDYLQNKAAKSKSIEDCA